MARGLRVPIIACLFLRGLAASCSAEVGGLCDAAALVQRQAKPAGPLPANAPSSLIQEDASVPADLDARQVAKKTAEYINGLLQEWQQGLLRSLFEELRPLGKFLQPQAGFKPESMKQRLDLWRNKKMKAAEGGAALMIQATAPKLPLSPSALEAYKETWMNHLKGLAAAQLDALVAEAEKNFQRQQNWPQEPNAVLDEMMEALTKEANKFTMEHVKPLVDSFTTWLEKNFSFAIPKKEAKKTPATPAPANEAVAKAIQALAKDPKSTIESLLKGPLKALVEGQALLSGGTQARDMLISHFNQGLKATLKGKAEQFLPSDISYHNHADNLGWTAAAVAQKAAGKGKMYFGGQAKGSFEDPKAATSMYGGAVGNDGSVASASVGRVMRPGKKPLVVASHFAMPAKKQQQPSRGVPPEAAQAAQFKAMADSFIAGQVKKSFARMNEQRVADGLKRGAEAFYKFAGAARQAQEFAKAQANWKKAPAPWGAPPKRQPQAWGPDAQRFWQQAAAAAAAQWRARQARKAAPQPQPQPQPQGARGPRLAQGAGGLDALLRGVQAEQMALEAAEAAPQPQPQPQPQGARGPRLAQGAEGLDALLRGVQAEQMALEAAEGTGTAVLAETKPAKYTEKAAQAEQRIFAEQAHKSEERTSAEQSDKAMETSVAEEAAPAADLLSSLAGPDVSFWQTVAGALGDAAQIASSGL